MSCKSVGVGGRGGLLWCLVVVVVTGWCCCDDVTVVMSRYRYYTSLTDKLVVYLLSYLSKMQTSLHIILVENDTSFYLLSYLSKMHACANPPSAQAVSIANLSTVKMRIDYVD